MPRYIDADELWLQLDKRESFEQGRNRAYYKGLRDAKKVLDEQPTADVVERKKAEWEICGSFDDLLRCSNCRFIMPMIAERFNFCPDCGADMKEETDGDKRSRCNEND